MRILLILLLISGCARIDKTNSVEVFQKDECLINARAKIWNSNLLATSAHQLKDLNGTKPGNEYLNFLASAKCDFYVYSLQPEKSCRSWLEGNKLDCMKDYWNKSVSDRRAPKELLFDILDFFRKEISGGTNQERATGYEKSLRASEVLDASLLALELISYRTRPADVLSFTSKKEEWAVYRIQQWENQSSKERIEILKKDIQQLIAEHGEMSKSENARKLRLERQKERFERLKASAF